MRVVGFMPFEEQRKMAALIEKEATRIVQSGAADKVIFQTGNTILEQGKALLSKGAKPGKERTEMLGQFQWAEPAIIAGTEKPTRIGLVMSAHPASVRYEYGLPYIFPAVNGRSAVDEYPMLAFMRNAARIAAFMHDGHFILYDGSGTGD